MKSSAYKVIFYTFTQVHSLQACITHHSTHLSMMVGIRKLSPVTTECWLCIISIFTYRESWVCLSTAAHHSHEEYCSYHYQDTAATSVLRSTYSHSRYISITCFVMQTLWCLRCSKPPLHCEGGCECPWWRYLAPALLSVQMSSCSFPLP